MASTNVERLATGYEDLVVILLEPADRDARMSYKEILSERDQTLRLAFNNQRNVKNTIILDSRPLRSREIRGGEKEETCQQNDGMAYTALGKVLGSLRPKVIVVCHCDSAGLEAGLPEYLFSSVRDAGGASFLPMKNGHSCVKISSFHPMFFARTETSSPLKRLTREHLFDATFVIASNALAGRTVCGFGIRNLRHCALDGPCFRLTEQGVNISYQWVGPEDVASSELVEQLCQLGFLSEPGVRTMKSVSKSI
ncbi:hypothetical protein B0J13DRAFT_659862 [Dactylonectria estremocensis]|uniref:Uncharacterized protein n=1 Tax=Dactylonectria estremocensis TaxID=1079267 RepID=A0A9P9D2T8_9HYPO|nr:hypothetical protein B0J13DRAFT_659862 [Dactylonectria estremocensis]